MVTFCKGFKSGSSLFIIIFFQNILYHSAFRNKAPRILKEFAKEIAPILSIIYQASIDTGHLPADWKTANISPIYKKSDRTKASNYRPVSLTSVPCKVLEHVVHSHIMKHFDAHNILTSQQHGFRAAHSCETQLIQTIHDFATSRNNLTQTDVISWIFLRGGFKTQPPVDWRFRPVPPGFYCSKQ